MNLNSYFDDIEAFHEKFGLTGPITHEEWQLRHARLREEMHEYERAITFGDDVETLDALVDLVYIALGTAYRRGWDFDEAWRRVHEANMKKVRAPSPCHSKHGSGFDIVKPEGWEAPDLSDLT